MKLGFDQQNMDFIEKNRDFIDKLLLISYEMGGVVLLSLLGIKIAQNRDPLTNEYHGMG